jgi:hypothetical protein
MNTTTNFLALSAVGTSLILVGCSKSDNSGTAANNSNGHAASSASVAPTATGPADLSIKWQPGKKYDMEMVLDQTVDRTLDEHPFHQELKLTQDYHYSVIKNLDNGGHQIELEFDRQGFGLAVNGKQIINFDSAQKTPDETNSAAVAVAAVMRAMLGAPIDYTLGADGTVEKIDGVDSMASRIAAAEPDQRRRAPFQQLFDEDNLKQYGLLSKGLPDHPVNIGDSWSSSQDRNNPAGVMTMNSTYTFKGREQHKGHNCVHLLVTGDIKTKSTSSATTGATVKIENGTISGDMWFDPDLGISVDDASEEDLTLNITAQSTALTEHMKENAETSLVNVEP